MKKILVLTLLLFSTSAFAYESFIITENGFATSGYNFYVDETGYMGLQEGLEAKWIVIDGHQYGTRGQDIAAASYTPIWWDGDYFHANGNAQVETLTKTLPESKEYTVYFTGTSLIKNRAPESVDGYPMQLKDSQDVQGPVMIKFIRDGHLWLSMSQTKY